jgi:hypothetical protein
MQPHPHPSSFNYPLSYPTQGQGLANGASAAGPGGRPGGCLSDLILCLPASKVRGHAGQGAAGEGDLESAPVAPGGYHPLAPPAQHRPVSSQQPAPCVPVLVTLGWPLHGTPQRSCGRIGNSAEQCGARSGWRQQQQHLPQGPLAVLPVPLCDIMRQLQGLAAGLQEPTPATMLRPQSLCGVQGLSQRLLGAAPRQPVRTRQGCATRLHLCRPVDSLRHLLPAARAAWGNRPTEWGPPPRSHPLALPLAPSWR